MTAEQVAALGPAFTEYLREFRPCFVTNNTFAHLGTYCRGLLSDLARESVEPIALAAACAVRTLQEFLTHHVWDHDAMLARLQRRVVAEHLPAPGQRDADEFRLAKGEVRFGHFEGGSWKGLPRHMIPCQRVLPLVAEQTTRLRGEKPATDDGADGPRPQRRLPALAETPPRVVGDRSRRLGHPLPPGPKQGRHSVPSAGFA